MNPDDVRNWASVPWEPVAGDNAHSGDGGAPIGWAKRSVPYVPGATSLQTLDVWIPRLPSSSSSSSSSSSPASSPAAVSAAENSRSGPPPSDALPPLGPGRRHWIVYIHGGAWRDPRVTSQSFSATAMHLLRRARTISSSSLSSSSSSSSSSSPPCLAGLISLNYRLSPHPDLPPPADPADPDRTAQHPDHIADVLTGLAFVRRLRGAWTAAAAAPAEDRLVLAGHSCGATLAFQAVMDPGRWGLGPLPLPLPLPLPNPVPAPAQEPEVEVEKVRAAAARPDAVVGLNGLYDLAGFIADPPASHAGGGLPGVFRQFVGRAFGGDERVWRAVCPATAEGDWVAEEWRVDREGQEGEMIAQGTGTGGKRKRMAVLVQSRDDDLVPYAQLESLRACLERSRAGIEVCEKKAAGAHNELWEEGGRLAKILEEVVEDLGHT